ncbi:hypothetical protein QJS10_CPA03g00702 [Acorus calamus]|uniref:Uncharacterized protein n=1 Tax=Acorus calamus TaxID=4465 RepID=A0AAV9F2Y4_ACOCL|nr:hypothetical protein QJS10_CPA03g00702 [Acorus calamus]
MTASNPSQLRRELDALHREAEQTRSKANGVRLRLMRLSEAAEKLQRQASADVRFGKENEARELLIQKRKVMQALDKSKGRIELFDKLLAKRNEAISVKETQLIGHVASHLEGDQQDVSSEVRILSVNETPENNSEEPAVSESTMEAMTEHEKHQIEQPIDGQQQEPEWALHASNLYDDGKIHELQGASSYEEFLEHIDQQLQEIETYMSTTLNLSTLVMDLEEKQKNTKVQQMVEILNDLRGTTERLEARNTDRLHAAAMEEAVIARALLDVILLTSIWGSEERIA